MDHDSVSSGHTKGKDLTPAKDNSDHNFNVNPPMATLSLTAAHEADACAIKFAHI